jgi:membrane associated rhomboid family serine protease
MNPGSNRVQVAWPKPGKTVKALLLLLVVCYVVELLLLRSGFGEVVEALVLKPGEVLGEGKVWQVATSTLLHSPKDAWHLLNNLLFLWMFGSPLEERWGSRKVLWAYVVSGLSGAVLTLLVALLSLTPVLSWLIPHFWDTPVLGASGAILGLTICWGMAHAGETTNFLFLGAMRTRTFMLLMVAMQLLIALSFDTTSSTSHFGGMIGGYLFCLGPGTGRRRSLLKRRKAVERQLEVIQGGKPDKIEWN